MIKTLFKAFIGFKLFQLLIALTLLYITYNIYPQPFTLILKLISNIK